MGGESVVELLIIPLFKEILMDKEKRKYQRIYVGFIALFETKMVYLQPKIFTAFGLLNNFIGVLISRIFRDLVFQEKLFCQ